MATFWKRERNQARSAKCFLFQDRQSLKIPLTSAVLIQKQISLILVT